MIVTLSITGGGSVVISAGGRESPANYRVGGKRVFQLAELLRAAAAIPLDRANVSTTISFDVTKEYSSVEAAEIAALDGPATYCKPGVMSFLASGGQTLARRLPCVVIGVDAKQSGIVLFWTFTLVGGLVAAVSGPPSPS